MKSIAGLLILSLAACASPRAETTPPMSTPDPSPATASQPPLQIPAPLDGVSERGLRLYREAIVIDAHNDMPTNVLDDGYNPEIRNRPGFNVRSGEGHTDFPRLLESWVTAQWMSAWVDAPYAQRSPDESYERALRYVDWIHDWVRRHPELTFATTAADVEKAKRGGTVAILIGVEGGHAIEASLDKLRDLYNRGVRYMTLTWNNGNQWAGSSVGVNGTRTGGLTDFGREVIREMNRLGMLVDISHVSDQTLTDVLAATRHPVIASHSSARKLNDHPRNLSDDQLRAIAQNGGVVNVNFFSRFIDERYRKAVEKLEERMEKRRAELATGGLSGDEQAQLQRERAELFAKLPATPFDRLIDHFDHIAKVAGIDHVGLGSDFDGVSALPEGMFDVTQLPKIAQALLDRGYSEEDVRKVLGGNMLRVMRQVLDQQAAAGP